MPDNKTYQLEIVTPKEIVFKGEVESLVVNAYKGSMGVLPNHAPLLALLKPGKIDFKFGGEDHIYTTADGFLEILSGKVRVITEKAEKI